MERLSLGLGTDRDGTELASERVAVGDGPEQFKIIPDRREAFLDGQFRKEVQFPSSTGTVGVSYLGQEPDWGDKGRYNN